MAGAVDQSISSIDQLDQRMTAARNAQWEKEIIAREALLETVDGTCTLSSTKCDLEIIFADDRPTRPYPATSVIPKAKAGLAGLKLYVANLKAIVDADTVNKVTTSANAALGSLANIEKEAKDAGGPDSAVVETYSEPTLSAINWLIGQYVDYVKFQALRKATRTAQPVIERLANFYDAIAAVASDYELAAASRGFVSKQEAFDDASPLSPNAIDTYVKAAEAYNLALRATSARPLKTFAQAHSKVANQLNGGISLSEAVAAIEDLTAKVREFKAIVDKFDAAADDG